MQKITGKRKRNWRCHKTWPLEDLKTSDNTKWGFWTWVGPWSIWLVLFIFATFLPENWIGGNIDNEGAVYILPVLWFNYKAAFKIIWRGYIFHAILVKGLNWMHPRSNQKRHFARMSRLWCFLLKVIETHSAADVHTHVWTLGPLMEMAPLAIEGG